MTFDQLKTGEHKFYAEIRSATKAQEGEEGVVTITGWANRYSLDGEVIVDRDSEVILPSAYDLDNFYKNPILLYMHDRSAPIGAVTSISLTPEGLKITAEVYEKVNSEVFNGVLNKVLKTLSVGFRPVDGIYDPEMDIYYYTKVELYEVSVVTIPANQDSIFQIVDSPCSAGVCALGVSHAREKGIKFPSKSENNDPTESTSVVSGKTPIYTHEQLEKLVTSLESSLSLVEAALRDAHKTEEGSPAGESNENQPGGEPAPVPTVAEAATILTEALKDPEKLEEVVGVYEEFSEGVNNAVEAYLSNHAPQSGAE